MIGSGQQGAHHIGMPRWPATAKMSLSPRPHMFITSRSSFGSVGASFATYASACAGSSAGMMPSSLRAELEGVERLLVGRRDVFDAAGVAAARRARGRRRDSRARPRSSGPRGSGRRRPAADRCGCRAARPGGRRSSRRHGHSRPRGRARPPRRRRSPRSASSRNGWNRPMAFEPPPMQATSVSGSRPSRSSICSRASRPITDWKSRTIAG